MVKVVTLVQSSSTAILHYCCVLATSLLILLLWVKPCHGTWRISSDLLEQSSICIQATLWVLYLFLCDDKFVSESSRLIIIDSPHRAFGSSFLHQKVKLSVVVIASRIVICIRAIVIVVVEEGLRLKEAIILYEGNWCVLVLLLLYFLELSIVLVVDLAIAQSLIELLAVWINASHIHHH